MTSLLTITRPLRQENRVEEDDSDVEMEDAIPNFKSTAGNAKTSIVTPGELVTEDPTWMKGHGTYSLENQTFSSVAGNVLRLNRLLSVIPIRGRYHAATGDYIVGRITEVDQKRWKVDIGCKQDAVLMLGSVNLPGGILRRKSESDELQMRNFLKEGDLLNAEVQSVYSNGQAGLHTRSLKYGKLRNGVLLKVASSLIVRQKTHSWNLAGNVSVIIGVNGFMWLSKTTNSLGTSAANASTNSAQSATASKGIYRPGAGSVSITRLEEESSWEIYSDKNEEISSSIRGTIARYYNVIKAMSACELGITENRICMGYDASMIYPDASMLVDREAQLALCQNIIDSETMRGE